MTGMDPIPADPPRVGDDVLVPARVTGLFDHDNETGWKTAEIVVAATKGYVPVADLCRASGTPAEPPACTGLTASHCPVHGDCACPRDEADGEVLGDLDDPHCPLHSDLSDHPAGPPAPAEPPTAAQVLDDLRALADRWEGLARGIAGNDYDGAPAVDAYELCVEELRRLVPSETPGGPS